MPIKMLLVSTWPPTYFIGDPRAFHLVPLILGSWSFLLEVQVQTWKERRKIIFGHFLWVGPSTSMYHFAHSQLAWTQLWAHPTSKEAARETGKYNVSPCQGGKGNGLLRTHRGLCHSLLLKIWSDYQTGKCFKTIKSFINVCYNYHLKY